MNRIIRNLALAFLTIVLVSCEESVTPILNIEGGKVEGIELTNSVVYKGIPYAAAPVGNLRWKKPQDVQPWDSVMIADEFGPAAIQTIHKADDGWYGTEFYWEGEPVMSEDCLYLNVWTPKGASAHPDKKLPVAVWIHGGAFTGGWGNETEFDGEAWAERDVILVTINYRLNIFGFLCHPLLSEEDENGVSGNYGLYDQVKALEWVYNNIAQFGGNPENITIFGQSAGAMSVKYLVSSPRSKDYISKAIIMSGGGISKSARVSTNDQSVLDAPAEDMFDLEGIYSLEDMRATSVETLRELVDNYQNVQKRQITTRPHVDNVLITDEFNDAAVNNTIADIPYMIGYVADDMAGLNKGIEEFAAVRDSLSQNPTYMYRFECPLPNDGRPCMEGTFHSAELWYVFHTLGRSWRPFAETDEALSNKVVDYWTNFAKYGNPNGKEGDAWQPATRENPYTEVICRSEN